MIGLQASGFTHPPAPCCKVLLQSQHHYLPVLDGDSHSAAGQKLIEAKPYSSFRGHVGTDVHVGPRFLNLKKNEVPNSGCLEME